VASGFFPDSTAVSPYRLVVHLTFALVLYNAIVLTGLSNLSPASHKPQSLALVRRLALASTCMVGLTIVAGGFVAGLHAGLTYNTFPLMDGRLVPEGYAALHPFWRNLTENIAAVQFDHRVLATVTLGLVVITALTAWRSGLPRALPVVLLTAVVCQYLLGVTTLLLVVPVPVATLHQFSAVMLLTAVLVALHHTFRTPPLAAIGKEATPAAAG
jgi:cytochrome c oxidase assembly protein subunit 15